MHAAPKRTKPVRTALLALGLAAFAAPAAAIDAPSGPRLSVPVTPPPILRARSAENEKPPNAMERLRTKLRRIPLRPVRIGQRPRRPDDPEPGMGVVLRIPF